MTQSELKAILDAHKKWLSGDPEGIQADLQRADLQGAYLQRADLQGAYLRGAYLQGAYLQGAYLQGAYLRGADLQGANLRGANLQGANLRGANLQGAYLREADLREANIDFACWPLWCGGLHVQTDARIMRQLAYHFCAQECDDPEYIHYRNLLLPFANHFSRVDECGKLEPIEEDAPC